MKHKKDYQSGLSVIKDLANRKEPSHTPENDFLGKIGGQTSQMIA